MLAESLNIDFIGLSVPKIKNALLGVKHGLGGQESKEAIRDILNKDGWGVTNLNESDAIAVYEAYKRGVR